MAKYKDYRKRKTTTVGEAIQEMLSVYRLDGKFSQKAVIGEWENLMGKPIASRTTKLFFKKEVLFVQLNSAALKHEMNMSKSKVLGKLQEKFGKTVVSEIVFL